MQARHSQDLAIFKSDSSILKKDTYDAISHFFLHKLCANCDCYVPDKILWIL